MREFLELFLGGKID